MKNRFSISEKTVLLLLATLGIFLRWYLLDERALHHDESLYGIYGKYFYINPAQKYYQYNPLLHGPFLYNILPTIYKFLGISKFAIRAVAASLGTLFIFTPLLFQRYFKKSTLIILVAYISLSPSLVYWSRFIRHDYLAIFFMLITLIGVVFVKEKYKAIVILPAFALQLCVKENFFITIALIFGYLLYDWLIQKLASSGNRSLIHNILTYPRSFPIHFLVGVLVAIFCYIYFYTSGFRYSSGILDGIYRKSLSYWLNQHSIERIRGPFSYQTLILGWYEFFFLLVTLIHLVHFYFKRTWLYRVPIIIALIMAILCHILFSGNILSDFFLWDLLKLKINFDFYPLFLIPTHAVLVTTYYLLKKNQQLSFWGYFFFASFFTYSYVGEKVPWLSIYPLTSGLVFLALYFQENISSSLFKKNFYYYLTTTLIVVCFAFVFRSSVQTNFTYSGQASEVLSQVHTDLSFEQKILSLKKELTLKGKRLFCHNIAIWPTSWFLYGTQNFFYGNRPSDIENFDYIIAEHSDYELSLSLLNSHIIKKIPFRSWWVPNYKKMNIGSFLKYTFTHHPWSNPGTLRVTFYEKKATRDLPSAHQ